MDEIWKVNLYSKSPGNIYRISHTNFNIETNPILNVIAESTEDLMHCHSKINQNFRKAYVFDNPEMTIGLRGPKLDPNTWGPTYEQGNPSKYYNLTFNEVFDATGNLLPNFLNVFNVVRGDALSKKLKKLYDACWVRYGKNPAGSESFPDLIMRVKKGSKTFRKILSFEPVNAITHNIVKFSENMEIIIDYDTSKTINSLWKINFLSNACRTFCFKLHNNILPYNHILSHFVRGKSRNCTFCDIIRNQEEEDETPLHLFYDCTVSENIRRSFFNDYLGYFISRQEFFAVPTSENSHTNKILMFLCIVFKKYIWDCKLNEVLPQYRYLKYIVLSEICVFLNLNSQLRSSFEHCNLNNDFKNDCRNFLH
jgi:hypothetical protein